MHAEKLILETDENGDLIAVPNLPQGQLVGRVSAA
jgi:hypothetical protein